MQRVDALEQIEALADGRRLAILRRLMVAPATLSQLGHAFGKHPAWIRHHLKKLEDVGLVQFVGTRELPGFTEKYYQAAAGAITIHRLIAPEPAVSGGLTAVGSHDLALEALALELAGTRHAVPLSTVALGSLDGLIALRQGCGDLAGCHLLDTQEDTYNAPYVERLFPGEEMVLLTLAEREQGLIVAPGNPLGLQRLADLQSGSPDCGGGRAVRFVNRKRGSGTRLWLDRALRQAGVPAAVVCGYDVEAGTHTEVAAAVAEGRADAGVGIMAAARRLGLGFVPLFRERYDLAMTAERLSDARLQPLLDCLSRDVFRHHVESLGGYDARHCGAVTPVGG
ncbi:MAG: substrate-binding domain-containing protein [Anaerolineae bacterium]